MLSGRQTISNRIFYGFVFLLIAIKFFHFGEAIDDPHAWRQCDTANYIFDFFKNGIDVLHPSVCWMGAHKTVLFEFPLYEVVAAWFCKLFGYYHLWARIVSLTSFMLSAHFLFKIISKLFTKEIAQFSILFYFTFPLSQFYSRAIHIDFMALSFALGAMHFFMKGWELKKMKYFIYGNAFAVLVCLIKIPYLFCLVLPCLYLLYKYKSWRIAIISFPFFLLSFMTFYFWQNHVLKTNSEIPDYSFLKGFTNFTNMNYWYYGNIQQRLEFEHWKIISMRIVYEVVGMIGLMILSIGLIYYKKVMNKKFILLWGVNLGIYILVFFNLNLNHNYYQIPFLPFLALVLGCGLKVILDRFYSNLYSMKLICFFVLISFTLTSTIYAEKNYYKINLEEVAIAKLISENTIENNLVIVNYGGEDIRCPNVLYRAHRNGWSVQNELFTPDNIGRLVNEGAMYLATFRNEDIQQTLEWKSVSLLEHKKLIAENFGILHLYKLSK